MEKYVLTQDLVTGNELIDFNEFFSHISCSIERTSWHFGGLYAESVCFKKLQII